MRWLIALLTLVGIVVGGLALREHYRVGASPCRINEKWDCGAVNKSPYAALGGIFDLLTNNHSLEPENTRRMVWIRSIPVAVVGMLGYLLLGILAVMKRLRLLASLSVLAMLFSLYLAHIEKDVLEVWCIYCVISLGIITLITLLSAVTVLIEMKRANAARAGVA
jgi:uncharacterized membrane protein